MTEIILITLGIIIIYIPPQKDNEWGIIFITVGSLLFLCDIWWKFKK